jgi:serine/threonine protein kinase
MQVLKLLIQHNIWLPYQVGIELGYGLDGQVFEMLYDPTKVIKFCVLYDEGDYYTEYAHRVQVLDYLLHNPSPIYARVIEHGKLGEGERLLLGNQKQGYILYYCVMERLKKLSEDEKKVFHSLLSHEDRGAVKNFSFEKMREILDGLEIGLSFSKERVISFCEQLAVSKVQHLDLHPRNVMVNSLGEFKLIDFDRTILKPVL